MARTKQPKELDATIAPALAETARRRPWERAVERQRLPEEEPGPATPRAPTKVAPVVFVHTRYGAAGYGLATRVYCFENYRLTLDIQEDIDMLRKHADFVRGVIFEESTMPAAAQLAFADRLEADRAREDARKIRVQAQRSAGPYGLGPGAPQGPRMKPGAARSDRRDDEWT